MRARKSSRGLYRRKAGDRRGRSRRAADQRIEAGRRHRGRRTDPARTANAGGVFRRPHGGVEQGRASDRLLRYSCLAGGRAGAAGVAGWSLEFAGASTQPAAHDEAILRVAVVAIAARRLAAPALAHAQSADLVLCDRLAADPADPDKPADVKGVPDIAAVRHRDRDQILQDRRRLLAAGDVSARPRLCRQPANAGSDRGLAQGRRQGLDLGDGRARRALWHRRRRCAGTKRRRANCSSARREAGNPRGVSNLAALGGGGGFGRSGAGEGIACRRPPRPMPRRNISSA